MRREQWPAFFSFHSSSNWARWRLSPPAAVGWRREGQEKRSEQGGRVGGKWAWRKGRRMINLYSCFFYAMFSAKTLHQLTYRDIQSGGELLQVQCHAQGHFNKTRGCWWTQRLFRDQTCQLALAGLSGCLSQPHKLHKDAVFQMADPTNKDQGCGISPTDVPNRFHYFKITIYCRKVQSK